MTDEIVEAVVLLNKIFPNDYEKIAAWLQCKNLNFGGAKPMVLFERGKGDKVLSFIKNAIGENKPASKDAEGVD